MIQKQILEGRGLTENKIQSKTHSKVKELFQNRNRIVLFFREAGSFKNADFT